MSTIERPGAERWLPARGDIRSLRDAAPGCRGCELWADATQVVFSTGSTSARIVLVGEQPGEREDIEGEPFIGPAGLLLAEAIAAAGIDRKDVYLTNAVKHFRFDERGKRRIHAKPAIPHIVACNPWLEAELAALDAQVVVCLGATAGRAVLGRAVKIGAERGRVLDSSRSIAQPDARVLLTMHPSAVIRLRGREGFDQAFGGLVADLVAAAAQLDA